MAREDWRVELVIHASSDELDAITERIGEVIWVPSDHDGRCETPWMMRATALADIDEPERASLSALLDDER